MSNVQVAMLAQQPYTLLRDAVFTHPTLTEGLGPLFARVPKTREQQLKRIGKVNRIVHTHNLRIDLSRRCLPSSF